MGLPRKVQWTTRGASEELGLSEGNVRSREQVGGIAGEGIKEDRAR